VIPVPWLIVGGFVVLVVIFTALHIRSRKQRTRHEAKIFRGFGFGVLYPSDKAARDRAHEVFAPFKSEYLTKRAIRVVARRDRSDRGDRGDRGGAEMLAVSAVLMHQSGATTNTMLAIRADVPSVEIGPRGAGAKIAGVLGVGEAPVVRGELSSRRSVNAQDPVALERLATEDFQSAILAGRDDEHWSLGDGWIRLCRPSSVSAPVVEHMVGDVERVARAAGGAE